MANVPESDVDLTVKVPAPLVMTPRPTSSFPPTAARLGLLPVAALVIFKWLTADAVLPNSSCSLLLSSAMKPLFANMGLARSAL